MRLRLPPTLIGRVTTVAVTLSVLAVPIIWVSADIMLRIFAEGVVDSQLRTFGQQLRGARAAAQGTGDFAFIEPDLQWVWQISVDGAVEHRSIALAIPDVELPGPESDGPTRSFEVDFEDTAIGRLRLATRTALESEGEGAFTPVTYTVGISSERYQGLVDVYVDDLSTLALVATVPTFVCLAALVVAVLLILRLSLNRVELAVDRFRHGATERIEGRFPTELARLIAQVNELLRRNAQMLDRTRRYVSKIAHDLNHPIAVLTNMLKGTPQQDDAQRQLERMGGLVERYTTLARAVGPGALTVRECQVRPVLDDTADSFRLLFRRTPLEIAVDCAPDLAFPVETADLEAILSNLVGNAHKYATARARISAARDATGLTITVDDDGPGIPAAARKTAVAWGRRLDEAPPGSGFGLTIVADLVELYGGSFALDESPMGGLRAEITLPGPSGAALEAEQPDGMPGRA